MRIVFLVGAVVLMSTTIACGGMSMNDYSEELSAAAACETGDVCVVGGGIECVCAEPINQSKEDEINELAKDVDCEGASVSCAMGINPRCENNICVADPG